MPYFYAKEYELNTKGVSVVFFMVSTFWKGKNLRSQLFDTPWKYSLGVTPTFFLNTLLNVALELKPQS